MTETFRNILFQANLLRHCDIGLFEAKNDECNGTPPTCMTLIMHGSVISPMCVCGAVCDQPHCVYGDNTQERQISFLKSHTANPRPTGTGTQCSLL